MISDYQRAHWPVYLAFALALTGAFIGMSTGLSRLHGRWLDEYSYSHGYLILAMSIWLATSALRAHGAIPIRRSVLGWAGLVLTVFVYTIADLVDLTIGMQVLVPIALLCIVAAIGGLSLAQKLLLPIGFLYFAIPIWDVTVRPLQLIATLVATNVLHVFDINAFIEGTVISTPGGTLVIGDACAGQRFFVVGLALAAFYGLTNYRTWTARILLGVVAAIASMVANWIRVTSLIMIGNATHMQHPLITEGHYLYGWAIFAVAMIPVFWLANHLERGQPWTQKRPNSTPTDREKAQPSRGALIGSGAIAAVLLAAPMLTHSTPERIDDPLELHLDTVASSWSYAPLSTWQPQFLNPQQRLHLALANDRGYIVDVYLARYVRPQRDAKLISRRNRLEADWQILEQSTATVSTRATDIEVNQMRLARGGEQRLVWYWYYVGGTKVLDRRIAKLQELVALVHGRRDRTLVAVSAPCGVDCMPAREAMRSLLAEFGADIEAIASRAS